MWPAAILSVSTPSAVVEASRTASGNTCRTELSIISDILSCVQHFPVLLYPSQAPLIAFCIDLLMELKHGIKQRFGTRGASGNVDVDRDDLVHTLYHGIGIGKRPAGVGAASHRYY